MGFPAILAFWDDCSDSWLFEFLLTKKTDIVATGGGCSTIESSKGSPRCCVWDDMTDVM